MQRGLLLLLPLLQAPLLLRMLALLRRVGCARPRRAARAAGAVGGGGALLRRLPQRAQRDGRDLGVVARQREVGLSTGPCTEEAHGR